MWRSAVTRLMGEASLVVMDLRGFGAHRRGCVYELETLRDKPLDRLVFLFDRTTDNAALKTLLIDHWQKLDIKSPNRTLLEPRLRLLSTRASARPRWCNTCWQSRRRQAAP